MIENLHAKCIFYLKGSPAKTKKATNAAPHPKHEDIIRGKLIESLLNLNFKHFPLGNKKKVLFTYHNIILEEFTRKIQNICRDLEPVIT